MSATSVADARAHSIASRVGALFPVGLTAAPAHRERIVVGANLESSAM
jgi:hypothetical protein